MVYVHIEKYSQMNYYHGNDINALFHYVERDSEFGEFVGSNGGSFWIFANFNWAIDFFQFPWKMPNRLWWLRWWRIPEFRLWRQTFIYQIFLNKNEKKKLKYRVSHLTGWLTLGIITSESILMRLRRVFNINVVWHFIDSSSM